MVFVPTAFNKYGDDASKLVSSKKYTLNKALSIKTGVKNFSLTTGGKISDKDSGFTGTLKGEWEVYEGQLEANVNTRDLLDVEYVTKEVTDGLTFTVFASHDIKDDVRECEFSGKANYSRDMFNGNLRLALLNPPAGSDVKYAYEVSGAASVGAEGFSAGGSFVYNGKTLEDYNAGFSYTYETVTAGVRSENKATDFVFSYYQDVLPKVKLGVEFGLNKVTPAADDEAPAEGAAEGASSPSYTKTFAVGLKNKVCDGAEVRAMVAYDGKPKAYGVYEGKLNDNVKLGVSSCLELQDLKGCKNTFGIKLTLGDI